MWGGDCSPLGIGNAQTKSTTKNKYQNKYQTNGTKNAKTLEPKSAKCRAIHCEMRFRRTRKTRVYVYNPPDTYFWPFRGRRFTMFIIWYRGREVSLCSSFICWFLKLELKKGILQMPQLIVWRHYRIEYPLKLSSGFCCELAFVCPGRWSLRLAPLTVYALGLSTPSSYGWTLRRWATLTYVWTVVWLASERCTKLRSTDEKVKW